MAQNPALPSARHVVEEFRMRTVIVGVGHWHAQMYADALAKLGASVLGTSDLDAEAGRAAAEKVRLPFETDSAALLDRVKPDLVFVLPRHDRAMDELRPVLDRRLPFLIEKPMGRTGVEARAVAEAAKKTKVFAASALANRSLAIWKRVEALQRAGQFGTLMHAHFRTVNGPPGRYRDWAVGWMLEPSISGGGAMRNLGFHGADAAVVLSGGKVPTVRGASVTHHAYKLPVEEFATAVVAAESGAVISLEAGYSYAAGGGDMEWRIAATGAYLRETRGRLEVRLADGTLEATDVPLPGYHSLTEDVLTRLKQGKPPAADVEDCARAGELIDRIYQSAGQGRTA
ncbi:MAG: Gfo/Idh/MocA family oxidoreductase [Alphaproteobacteria bacterium]|nr:Gfo/Idh/MocA family oxidoreductase [Alphaproteobacteria bacterium]